MLYEYHSNQTGDPNAVLMHCLGQWRLTECFHDLIYHPKVVVCMSKSLQIKKDLISSIKKNDHGNCIYVYQGY